MSYLDSFGNFAQIQRYGTLKMFEAIMLQRRY